MNYFDDRKDTAPATGEPEDLSAQAAETAAEVSEAVEEVSEAVEEAITENLSEEGQEAASEAVTESLAEANEKVSTKKAKKSNFVRFLRSEKFRRSGMATVMSVVFIAIVVVVNILVSVLSDRFPSMNIDLTAKKLNSLSDQALDVAKSVTEETTIYLIGSENSYRKDRIYSSYNSAYNVNMRSSLVANLAEKLEEANRKISVEFIDPDSNPTFISQHSDTTLVSGMVLVETAKRSRALTPGDMFSLLNNATGTGYDVYSKIDGALAGALEMVNLDKVPIVTIATGHNELLATSSIAYLLDELRAQNFEVEEINFLTDEIPEDTQVLLLPTPNTDYTQEELQKIRDYLDDETRDVPASLLLTCHPTQGTLPNLAGFLEEWGVQVEQGMVAETDSSRSALGSPAYVFVDANKEVLTDNKSTNLLTMSSCPIRLIFEGNGDVSATALWTTADSAYVVTEDMTEAEMSSPDTSAQTVASISAKYIQVNGARARRSVIVFGSSYIFMDQFMSATAFGNKGYIVDLMKYATGTDGSVVTVYSESVQTTAMDVTASQSTVFFLGLGVFTIAIPLAILVAGLAIFLKRRHL